MIWSLKNINLSTIFESTNAIMNTKILQWRELLTFSDIPKHSKLTESIKIRDRLSTYRLVSFPYSQQLGQTLKCKSLF